MAIPATIGVGGHAHDAEITDMQKAVQALLGAFVSSVLTVAAGGTGSGTGALAQEAWTAPTLLNSWVNFGGAYAAIGYMKDSQGFVHLRGGAKSGTINTNLFVLPAGYRPAASIQFPVVSNNAFGAVQIDSSGNVLPFVGNNVTLFIDGITFDTR